MSDSHRLPQTFLTGPPAAVQDADYYNSRTSILATHWDFVSNNASTTITINNTTTTTTSHGAVHTHSQDGEAAAGTSPSHPNAYNTPSTPSPSATPSDSDNDDDDDDDDSNSDGDNSSMSSMPDHHSPTAHDATTLNPGPSPPSSSPPFTCCSKPYHSDFALKRHRRENGACPWRGARGAPQKFLCDICGRELGRRAALVVHVEQVHGWPKAAAQANVHARYNWDGSATGV